MLRLNTGAARKDWLQGRRGRANLEQELLAAAKGPKIEVSIDEIRKKGLIGALRERSRRA